MDHYSMWKAVASGQAGRAGVFAAILAKAGMEGPHLPFEGKSGWLARVAREKLELEGLGGTNGAPFRIVHSLIKHRASCGTTISSIIAAEKVAPIANVERVSKVTVEVYKKAKDRVGTGEHRWNPDCRETADHSIPYVVAAALMDGTVTPRSFDDAHLSNPRLRALIQKIEVVPNEEYTKAYVKMPVEHRTRVTVVMDDGERASGETGADADDLSTPKTDAQIVTKFRGLTEEYLGAKRVKSILDRLWAIERMENVAEVPPAFVLA
jgi:2-methylcitrate dehydratase